MKKCLFILAAVVLFSVPSFGHACAVGSSHNITCTQITDLSGGLCANTLSAFITPTNVGDVLVAWTDNDSTTTSLSNFHDQINGAWTRAMPTKGWDTNASPTNFDNVWIVTTTTTSALNISVSCPNSFEVRIAEFHSSVGTVAVDCVSGWTAYDAPAGSMTTTCNPAHSNDFGLTFIDWGSVNPTPTAPWTLMFADTEGVMAGQALNAAAALTGTWTGNNTDHYVTSTMALSDGGAATRYVAQSAGSFVGGSICNGKTAISAATFNATSNSAGDVDAFCGTITTALTPQTGGSTGFPVTLLFDTGANASMSPGMSTAVIELGSTSNWIIDGGTGQPCGWNTATNLSEGSCNGIVRNMLYGSSNGVCPGGTCTTQYSSTGNSLIHGTGSNVEIRNLEIGPCYVHTPAGAGATDTSGGCGTITDESGSNWTIHDNKIHDGAWSINIQFNNGNPSNITINNNELYFNSHHVAVDGGAHTLNNFNFFGNLCRDNYPWDTTGDAWHANCVHFFGTGGGTVSNAAMYNNIQSGNTGADITGMFFNEANVGTYTNFAIFNNLQISTTSPDLGGSNHFWGPGSCNSGCFIYNNTSSRQTITGGNFDIGFTGTMIATGKNNIIQGASTSVAVADTPVTLTFDHNAYGPSTSCWSWFVSHSITFSCTFATWKSFIGSDANSIFNNSTSYVTSAGNFKPQAGSPLIGAGVNVCVDNPSFCTSYPAIKSDLAGVIRPPSAAWDIGAYQGTSGVATAPTFTTPASCPYSGIPTTVVINDPNAGTHVTCVTRNGATPATSGDGIHCSVGIPYLGPFTETNTQTIQAISGTSIAPDSSVASCGFTITSITRASGVGLSGVTLH